PPRAADRRYTHRFRCSASSATFRRSTCTPSCTRTPTWSCTGAFCAASSPTPSTSSRPLRWPDDSSGGSMDIRCPVVIDPAGTDIYAEATRIREQGPVGRIVLPGGVLGWSVTGYEAAKQVLSDPRFSKDPRKHWTAYVN